ncbi:MULTISPECIES: hypothetical protein [Streptomyces]|uniref:3-(3-hydroxy-phenyl)propionate hydroxylase n=1 Tax=Streptomyces melanosporofaciens TaxID=67327 RepID=A0A1H4KAV1_STRMJ|nr:hypothetical protein [Streptomyces melanosporofaciens]SEB55669.1 3-(3-hydroxy-phenyl)propionate hydroxylase [Streptomyces melanosporofaciens]
MHGTTIDPTAPPGDTDAPYDVVLIGYGPVGQTLAALLGPAGHRVAVLERWPRLYGSLDRVFLAGNARALYDSAASPDKRWAEWPDGDHCLYNHSHEKHVLVADWFADRLRDSLAREGGR